MGKSVFVKYSLKFYAQEPTPNPSQEGNNLCHDKICGFKLYTDSRSLSVSPQNPHKENKNSYTIELGLRQLLPCVPSLVQSSSIEPKRLI